MEKSIESNNIDLNKAVILNSGDLNKKIDEKLPNDCNINIKRKEVSCIEISSTVKRTKRYKNGKHNIEEIMIEFMKLKQMDNEDPDLIGSDDEEDEEGENFIEIDDDEDDIQTINSDEEYDEEEDDDENEDEDEDEDEDIRGH